MGGVFINPAYGLSPRVRGNPNFVPRFAAITRSIPACAGEPKYRVCHANVGQVYPRVCGGTWAKKRFVDGGEGLSPRVRGNRRQVGHPGRVDGSIPACAGEPGGQSNAADADRVYPRVCGGTASVRK